MTTKEILKKGYDILKENNIEEPNLKARRLLANILEKDKEYLIINENEEVNNNKIERFFSYIERIKNFEPIQYIINEQEFMGIKFFVNENVLIPQPDTETLAYEVIKICDKFDGNSEIKILDLCTGSGAIAISLSRILKERVKVYASDISEEALRVANTNIIKNLLNIELIQSNLFENIDLQFDIIVSNPPYIETETLKNLPEEVKKEPQIALDGGEDGLKFYNEIILNAKKHLNTNGYLAFEIGYNQKEKVEEIFKKNNYKNIFSKKDLSGNNRVVIAQK